MNEQPIVIFDKPMKAGDMVDWILVGYLSELLMKDDQFDVEQFLSIPNATKAGIKKLHKAHIERRKK